MPETPTAPTERVTHSLVRDVRLPGGAGVLALVTLDNGLDHTKPNTLGPAGMAELKAALEVLRTRAEAGEIAAVGVTGKPYFVAAGADLKGITSVRGHDEALELGRMGHAAYAILGDLRAATGVPTFAFVNGLALGGGLEVALNCDYRTVASDAAALGLPETGIGLVPGWGGAYLVPRLVGVEKAVEVILTRPAANKPYKPAEALKIGLVDELFEAADFLEQSIIWAAKVVDRRDRGAPPRARPAARVGRRRSPPHEGPARRRRRHLARPRRTARWS